ncbi:FecR domain-containing protein [bacterium]|nr:FecR domain-containing protein [bacterium]
MRKRTFYNLCAKALAGELTDDERIRFGQLCRESDKWNRLYMMLKDAAMQNKSPDEPPVPQVGKEWRLLEKHLSVHGTRSETIRPVRSRRFQWLRTGSRPALLPAAALLLAILTTAVWIGIRQGSRMHTIVTGNAERQTVTLPDGSEVILNSGSTLRYKNPFDEGNRVVNLSGEGFFSIVKDVKPFVVLTQNARTTVLGTRFDVWSRSRKTRVFVQNGVVRLSKLDNGGPGIELRKNDQSMIAGGLSPSRAISVPADRMLGWIDGSLVFHTTPLSEVLTEIERHYDITVILQDPRLKEKTLTATFRDMDYGTVIRSVCTAMNIPFSIDKDIITVGAPNHETRS